MKILISLAYPAPKDSDYSPFHIYDVVMEEVENSKYVDSDIRADIGKAIVHQLNKPNLRPGAPVTAEAEKIIRVGIQSFLHEVETSLEKLAKTAKAIKR